MFKNILPQEARVSKRNHSSMNNHLKNSALSPLAIAMHSGAVRITSTLKRFAKKRYS